MNNTVKKVMESLHLAPYTHVIVRHRESCGMVALGGSRDPDYIVKRFGTCVIERTFVVESRLYFDVK